MSSPGLHRASRGDLEDACNVERGGLILSFWERETLSSAAVDPAAAGAALRRAHELLVDYDAPLPRWGGFAEAREVLARVRVDGLMDEDDLARVDAAWERAERIVEDAESRSAAFQAVHGDAHIGNVLATQRGPLWTDWEDAFVGPIEFDIACLSALGLVRNVQVIPWLAVFARRTPELLPRMRARIAKLPVRSA